VNGTGSQFSFLGDEWAEVFEPAEKAESASHSDPRTSCFYARRALKLAVHWLYKSDGTLKLPHSESLSALIFEPKFLTKCVTEPSPRQFRTRWLSFVLPKMTDQRRSPDSEIARSRYFH